MDAHFLKFFGRQRAGLGQDVIGNRELPDIVEQSPAADVHQLVEMRLQPRPRRFIGVHHERHARKAWRLGRADGHRLDVVAAAPHERRDAVEHSGSILDAARVRVAIDDGDAVDAGKSNAQGGFDQGPTLRPLLQKITDYTLANRRRLGLVHHIFDHHQYHARNDFREDEYTGSDAHETHTHSAFGEHSGKKPPWL